MEKEKKRKGKRPTKKVFASIPRVPSRCSYVKISKRLLGSYFRRDRRPKIGSVLSISHIWISKSFFPSFLFLFVFVYQTLEIVHWRWVSIYIYICLRNFPLEIVFSSNGRNIGLESSLSIETNFWRVIRRSWYCER